VGGWGCFGGARPPQPTPGFLLGSVSSRWISRLPPNQLESLRLTQDQLAARLGTVREVVARSLRDLERSGAICVRRRQIQILDESLLRAWAQEP